MAAGLGFKTFTTGEVLTAADTNGYLMQGVLVFASAAARNAAITSPQEGQFAFTKDTNGLWYYDGAAWVASGATGDIEGVTAGTGISGGGTSGTVTITNSMATEIAAKGDLIVGTGSATFDNLAVGTNGMTIVADSTASTGLAYKGIGVANGLTTTGDTIYSSSGTTQSRLGIGSTGQVLTVASGVPSWATPATPTSGLVWLARTTASNAASIQFNGVFTSTYNSYKIVMEDLYGQTDSTSLYMQLQYSTSTAQTSYYGQSYTATTATTMTAATEINLIPNGLVNANNEPCSMNLTVSPAGGATTVFCPVYGVGFNADIYRPVWVGANTNPNGRTYTGFKVYASSGNIYGSVSVYGLAKS